MLQPHRFREVPPTAGLPLRWRDFLPLPARRSLEAELAAFVDVPEVQIECSGTAALILTLEALKRESTRRSVIVPAYTCPLVALAILHCGLTPMLCDVRGQHFDLCPDTLAAIANDDTLAIIPTHLGGRVAHVASAIEVASRVGAAVIEDAAQSLGATWRGRAVGTIGDAGFFSLAVGKGLTLYEGGVLTARDEALRRRLRKSGAQIPYRVLWEARRLAELAAYAAFYRPFALPLAYGLPLRRALRKGNVIAAAGDDYPPHIPLHRVGVWRRRIGRNAFERLPSFLEELCEQSTPRRQRLAAIRGLTLIDDSEGCRGTWPFFMVLMPSEESRDAALARLWPAGVGVTRLFVHALPDYPFLAPRFDAAHVPAARDFAARMLTISNSPWLREQEFQAILCALEETIAENNRSLTR